MRINLFIPMLIVLGCLFGCPGFPPTPSPEPSASDTAAMGANAAVTLGYHSTKASPTPAPPLPPAPDAQCSNCKGKAWVGDGTVFSPCPVCNPDGKKPRIKEPMEELPDKIGQVLKPSFERMIEKLDVIGAVTKAAIQVTPIVTPAPAVAPAALPPPASQPTSSILVPAQKPAIQGVPPPVKDQSFVDKVPGHWTWPKNQTIRQHLINDILVGGHGQSITYLNGRTDEELKSLHDSLHEGLTVGMAAIQTTKSTVYSSDVIWQNGCPDGMSCPNKVQTYRRRW